jgi:hypothetical protein
MAHAVIPLDWQNGKRECSRLRLSQFAHCREGHQFSSMACGVLHYREAGWCARYEHGRIKFLENRYPDG